MLFIPLMGTTYYQFYVSTFVGKGAVVRAMYFLSVSS